MIYLTVPELSPLTIDRSCTVQAALVGIACRDVLTGAGSITEVLRAGPPRLARRGPVAPFLSCRGRERGHPQGFVG